MEKEKEKEFCAWMGINAEYRGCMEGQKKQIQYIISYPADEYPQWAWEDWNLISVSLATHKNKLENRKTGELTEEGLRLQKVVKPGTDWRK